MSNSDRKLKVVLTGTTGNLGSAVLKYLIAQVSKSSIIISQFNPSAKPDEAEGIEIRKGNYLDPQSLDKAYDGADILFMISYPGFVHQVRVEAHINAIEAAKRSSIKHIVYTSLALAGGPLGMDSINAVMQAHLTTETYLKTQLPPSISYTILREGIYTEYFPVYLGLYDVFSKPSEAFIPPGDDDKLIAFTKRDELAEATANVIRYFLEKKGDEEEFVGKTVWLSAEPKYSLRSLGVLLGSILGIPPVEIKYVSVEEFSAPGGKAAALLGSAELAKDCATAFAAIGRGEVAYTGEGSQDLERILGRKPEDVEITLKKMFGIM